MKTKQKHPHLNVREIFTIASIAVVIIGCIANAYGAYVNQRFIQTPESLAYYFRYIILLAGGFAAGYLLTRKSTRQAHGEAVTSGAFYAVLATVLYETLDIIRLAIHAIFGELPVRLEWLLFLNESLIALAIALLILLVTRRQKNGSGIGMTAKVVFITAFAIIQVRPFITDIPATLSTTPTWDLLVGLFTSPLVIAAVAYFIYGRLHATKERIFYAALTGVLYGVLTLVLWELRTNPSADATSIFSAIVITISLIFAGALALLVRKKARGIES